MGGARVGAGRPRKPSAVKKMNGSYRPSRAAKGEVTFPVSRLSPPVWLDERALEEWNRIVPLLDSVKVLTDPDLSALANYCSTVSVAIRATIETNKSLMAPMEKGSKMKRVSPYVKIAKEARQECLRFAIEFGLTPAARSRIMGQPKDGDGKDADEDFLFHPPKLVVSNK